MGFYQGIKQRELNKIKKYYYFFQDGGSSILLALSVTITASLSLILLTILYKLYQTYQPTPPPTYQINNNSFNSLDTQLSALDNQVQLQPILLTVQKTERNSLRKKGIHGSLRRSQTMPRCPMLNQGGSTKPFVHQEFFSVESSTSETMCSVDIPSGKLSLQSDHCQFYKKMRKTGSVPQFQDKWKFPRYNNQIQEPKYLSL